MINRLLGPLRSRLPENNKLERIWILAKTDFRKRYYGTNLGIVWAFMNPLFRLVIYYVVFTLFFQVKIENFALYIFSGLLIWMFFSEATKKSMAVFKSKQYIYENIRIDRLDLFTSALLAIVFGFAFNLAMYFLVSLFFPVRYSLHILWFIPLILNLVIFVFAMSLILAVINLYLRDISHVWDMVTLLLFWTCPIFYGREIIFKEFPIIGYLNPLSGMISNSREILLYASPPRWEPFLYDYTISLVLLGVGIILFRKHSHKALESA